MRIFSREETNLSKDPLVRLLRLILWHRGVTVDDFNESFSRWHRVDMGYPPAKTTLSRSNHRRRLLDIEKMTFPTFQRLLNGIFRLNVKRVAVVIEDDDGQEITYHHQLFVTPDNKIFDPVANAIMTPYSNDNSRAGE